MRILIVGHGVVGKNLEKELEVLHPDVIDKYKPEENKIEVPYGVRYDIAFICVDTPIRKEERVLCDTSEVKNAIMENEAEIYVIKNTVSPGTTEQLRVKTGKRIIFSPEYYGGTQHCNNFRFDFTILGGERKACIEVIQVLQHVYDARHQFRITDSRTAELTKYMENSFLATKVSFCQQFYFIASEMDVDYEELRELFVLDPRVNPSHTFVDRLHPYWSSHCLDKDVPAIADAYEASLLQEIIKFNENTKKCLGIIRRAEIPEGIKNDMLMYQAGVRRKEILKDQETP